MLVTSSSDSSVPDTEMVTFTFEEKHVIIRFFHLRGMKPIEIHQQLSETCNDDILSRSCNNILDTNSAMDTNSKLFSVLFFLYVGTGIAKDRFRPSPAPKQS
jgi:hypothetical protein